MASKGTTSAKCTDIGNQQPILNTPNGGAPPKGTPPVATTGMDPEKSSGSEFCVAKQNQVTTPTDSNTGKENVNSGLFTPKMQGIRDQLEEAKTTTKKEKQGIESADRAAQRIDAKREARRRLETNFALRSVTFQNTSNDVADNTVETTDGQKTMKD